MQVHQCYVGVSLNRIMPLRITNFIDHLVHRLLVGAFAVLVGVADHELPFSTVLPHFLLLLRLDWDHAVLVAAEVRLQVRRHISVTAPFTNI